MGGGNLPGYNTITPTTVHLASASLTHLLSPKLLLEVRAGYNRFHETFSPEDQAFDPRSVGLNTVSDAQDFGLPLLRVSGYAPAGGNLSLPRGRTDSNYQFFTNLSHNAGRHNLKFGYEFRRTTVDGYFDAGYRGRLDFDSLEDFVAGRVAGGRQARGDSRRYTFQNSHGLYAQDSFQVSRQRSPLNLGLRWDYFGVIGEEKDRFSIFDTQTGKRDAGHPALPQGLEQHLASSEPGLRPPRRRQDRGARGLGALLRRLLPGLLRGPAPLEHLQPRPGVQRH